MPKLDDVVMMRVNRNNAYSTFCNQVLSQVVGRNKWKMRGSSASISEIATVSDEAFAILLFENNYTLWNIGSVAIEDDPANVVTDVKPTAKYTLNGAGTKKYKGWTDEGLLRFNKLAMLVHADRIRDKGKFEAEQKQMKKDAEDGKKGKKRKRQLDTESQKTIHCYIEGDIAASGIAPTGTVTTPAAL